MEVKMLERFDEIYINRKRSFKGILNINRTGGSSAIFPKNLERIQELPEHLL
jgi:hypothetical protein